jgi:hypothetical protein
LKIRLAALALGAMLLAGCTTISHVPSGERVVINDELAVQPSRSWSRLSGSIFGSHVTEWTMDGHRLNLLCFIAGLEDNTSIHRTKIGKTPEPVFRSNMSPTEVMELFEAAMSRSAGTPVIFRTSGLRPERFAGVPGFRFDFSFVDQADEVERKGTAVGAIHKGKLYLVFYHGARIHFFGKNLPEVEAIVRSAKLL